MKPSKAVHTPVTRASSVSLTVICPASARPGVDGEVVDPYESDGTATVGQNVHRALALLVLSEDRETTMASLPLNNEEVQLVDRAMAWLVESKLLRGTGKSAEAELRLKHGMFSGTIDFLLLHHSSADIVDFKSTFREDDHEAQLTVYAYLVFMTYDYVEFVNIYTPFLRREVVAEKTLSRKWVMAWVEEYAHNVAGKHELYKVGDHCLKCKRRNGCAAVFLTARQTALELGSQSADGRGLLKVDGPMIARLYAGVQILQKAIDSFDTLKKLYVAEHGYVDLGDGRELRQLEVNKDSINAQIAWPVLDKKFTDDEKAKFLTVGKTAMLDLIASKSARGNKERDKTAFMKELEAVGAVSKTPTVQVRAMSKLTGGL